MLGSLRICPQCGIPKILSAYYFRNGKPTGCCKECDRPKKAKWRAEHPDLMILYANNWNALHPEFVKQFNIDWKEAHPGKRREYSQRRRARMQTQEIEIFSDLEIFERDGWICQICFDVIDPEIKLPDVMCVSLDHIMPISRGGSHTRINVQAAHLKCNTKKANVVP